MIVLGRKPVIVVVEYSPAPIELEVAAVEQHGLQARPGPLHAGLGTRDAYAEPLGQLLLGEAFVLGEVKGLAVVGGQAVEEGTHRPRQVRLQLVAFGVGGLGGHLPELRRGLPRPVVVEDGIAGHPVDWPTLRGEVSLQTGTPTDGAAHLDACRTEMDAVVRRLRIAASRGATVKVQEGRLLFDRDPAEGLPKSVEELGREISARLPKVELTDLLVEVDRLTGFSRFFAHAGGSERRMPDLRVHLYASILAQATNIGPVRMAELSDLSYRKLAWASTWYLREDTLKDAVAAVVNYHHGLPLSASWGGGTLSSSDGQRFAVDVKARNARAIPRYFGYGRGVTHYSWTSDQYSQYGTKVIPSTIRDATHVLDGILGNETDLLISEHTVDTHGFTEMVFCLFAALGLRFSPRIRDLSDQLLYRMGGVGTGDGPRAAAFAKDLLRGKINERLILRHWDDILRVAGSLKLGWTPASLLVSRLQAKPRKSGLAKAIQEYGRLQKTLFILRYAENLDLRRRIGRQLNKGEELGALKDFLFFANDGNIRKHQPEEQTDQALCLSLLVDAFILWNTVHYQGTLDDLRIEGYPVNDEDLAHLSPTRYAHVNPYGRYRFDLEAGQNDKELRLPGTF